jgi:hypothetical protein
MKAMGDGRIAAPPSHAYFFEPRHYPHGVELMKDEIGAGVEGKKIIRYIQPD